MLQFSSNRAHDTPVALTPDEDRNLRLAFGRFADNRHRRAGEDVVSLYYEKKRCFHCDCRPDATKAPLLFLVTGTHIRREADGKGTPHDEGCEFARDHEEQKRLVLSYRRSPDDHKLNLVREFSKSVPQPRGTMVVTTKRSRPTLARVLCSLLHDANLDRFFSTTPLQGNLDQQIDDLLVASESYTIFSDQPLRPWLATSLPDYYRLKERLNHRLATQRGRSLNYVQRYGLINLHNPSKTTRRRPYGLFIGTFDRIENKTLYPRRADKKPIPVIGDLAVFGEDKILRRPPYLVIGLLTQPSRKAASVELLNAYAHPCVAWDRLTLVDSNLERETLALLISCRDWLAQNHNITFAIQKPHFDVGPDETENAREVCIPDFILRPQGHGIRHQLVVVETMGTDDPDYRERKKRMRLLFEQIGKGPYPVPVIEHDRFQTGKTAQEIDQQFCRTVCTVIANQSP